MLYFIIFRRRQEAINLKHVADKTTKSGGNAKSGALQYFMSAIEFIFAFQANDRYHEVNNPTRIDIAQKNSMASWETMRQFMSSVTVQCHSNGFKGLDGLAALMEVLVYFKVYNYQMCGLKGSMRKSGKFQRPKKGQESNPDEIQVPAELAYHLMECTDDWVHIQKRLDECRHWLTPEVVREKFPKAFAKWCIHPSFMTEGVKVEKTATGTMFPRVQWPIGIHMHLIEVIGFIKDALDEYVERNNRQQPPSQQQQQQQQQQQ
jgi:hypothetical protein